ncbi:MAG: tyrosine-type recombinase/integrase, partial [Peptostreptococcaceae bacterium]|nr:tyrosine-type recombinase/integrase [Peptostreptococcaceae bacterium]
ASLLLEEGVDIKYIQEFLGHSSIKTTQIYLHTSSGRKREILAEMHPRRKLGPK